MGTGPSEKAPQGAPPGPLGPQIALPPAAVGNVRCCVCEARATQRLSLRLGSKVAAVLLVCADHAACARQPGAWGLLSDPLVMPGAASERSE